MRRLLAVIAVAIAPLALPQQAFACSCLYFEDEQERLSAYYNNADVVLQGVPINMVTKNGTNIYNVSIEKVWKGKADAYIDIRTADNEAACGIDMELDSRMIIFANNDDGVLYTSLCSGTTPAKQADDIIQWLSDPPAENTCEPYICNNGEVHPSCTEDGHVIHYLVNPCQFSDNEEPENEYVFTDVPDTHPNASAIAFVKDEGIVQGYEDGTFGPNLFINRAEFTKIIINAALGTTLQVDNCSETLAEFTDVNAKDDWYVQYLCAAKQNHIIDGYPDHTFRASSTINFAEAAKIVISAFDIKTRPADEGDIWWRPYVFALARIGGLPSSFTDPNQQLTRGDMAEIIYRVMMGIEH